MRTLVLLLALLFAAAPPSQAAQRGRTAQGADKAPETPGGRAEAPPEDAGRAGPRVEIDVDRARARMNVRLNWLNRELKLHRNQQIRLRDLFELEVWSGAAQGVEPFPDEPDLSKPFSRTEVRRVTRGELEDGRGPLGDSPQTAQQSASEKEGGGRGPGRGRKAEPVSEPDPDVPSGLSPGADAALRALRAEEVEVVVRTIHPMLADLTPATLNGVMPLLEVAQMTTYRELLGDDGLQRVRAHAAQRMAGYPKLEAGVNRITPVPVTEWTVAKRPVRRRGRGGGGRRRKSLVGQRIRQRNE